jgi:hypothetical protein
LLPKEQIITAEPDVVDERIPTPARRDCAIAIVAGTLRLLRSAITRHHEALRNGMAIFLYVSIRGAPSSADHDSAR